MEQWLDAIIKIAPSNGFIVIVFELDVHLKENGTVLLAESYHNYPEKEGNEYHKSSIIYVIDIQHHLLLLLLLLLLFINLVEQ